jgi:serine/threonine protein kinase/tetratricopeptide (TPR) repeat protein
MAEQSNRAKSIFLEAVDGHPPEGWPAFLDGACAGDAPLRAEVEKLLRAQMALGSFQEATRPAPAAGEPADEGPGTAVGPYRVLERIGEGGFGIVFRAEQQGPIRRQVALKVLKPGLDTGQVLARFEAERQALGLMDHPNIAKVLDAGATDAGRPFFVMELVNGAPITEFCDANRLPPEARLRLFLDVCRAIQHAHHKGVVHRDIKPANVLVAPHDGRAAVKVIDFGVAKAKAERLTERTLLTARGQMIGTPAYMSPEQAENSGLDIDTRSDIYSLGVLLYELLTGTTPLEGRRLAGAGYAELQRLIREEEAPRPSARLASLGAAAAGAAGDRGLDARRLGRLLAGDLDWVVMKALEKDRDRRYATPDALAEDVERYLRREAVLARPPSVAYRLRKFARRNRAVVLAAAAVAAALLGGAAVATWQAVVATRAGAAARAAAEAERRAKDEALAREATTRAVLQFLEVRVLSAARPEGRPGGLGHEVTLRQALEAALPSVGASFADEPLIEARLRLTLGTSFADLGDSRTAAEQFEAARALLVRQRGPDHPDTLRCTNNLANSYSALGRHADALRLYEEVLASQRAVLGPDHPDTLTGMGNLASSYHALGRHADALKLREETLARQKAVLGSDHPDTLTGMNNLANSYAALGRHADALRLREETLARQKAVLGADHPETLRGMNNLAGSYLAAGRYTDALRLDEEALALRKAKLGPDHPDTLESMSNLAMSYTARGRRADALRLFEEVLALRTAKLGPDHPDTLRSTHNLGVGHAALGRHARALKLFEEALARRKAVLGPDHPDTLTSMWAVADSLVRLKRGAEAVPVIDECVRRAAGQAVPPRLLPGVTELRLRHFQAAGDAAGCRRTAEMWEELRRGDADSLYNAACLRAVTAAVTRAADTSAEGGARADAEADRAMAWLKQAVAAGYHDAAHLARDADLDALRGRADFADLMTTLRARPPGAGPSSNP